MKQTIYSRYEIPVSGKQGPIELFRKYKEPSAIYDTDGIQIGGISIGIRSSGPRAVILLTYDDEADSYLMMKYGSIPGLKYKNLRKSIK